MLLFLASLLTDCSPDIALPCVYSCSHLPPGKVNLQLAIIFVKLSYFNSAIYLYTEIALLKYISFTNIYLSINTWDIVLLGSLIKIGQDKK